MIAALITDCEEMHHKILIAVLIVGIVGNLFALLKLVMDSSKKNFTILLKCLMINNAIGLTGITTLTIFYRHLSQDFIKAYSHWFCSLGVFFRFFGICSACIAVFMSIERYTAVCHIFFHQVHVTNKLKKKTLIGVSFLAAVIAFAPFFGFGLYIDKDTKKCMRYKEAKTAIDGAYAILMFTFGTLICIIIVTFNTLVIKALFLNMRRRKVIVFSSTSLLNPTTQEMLPPLEIKFSKLMVMLDLSFVICWMPEMISIIFALTNSLPKEHWFIKVADTLMALHFSLDPYIYMLSGKFFVIMWNFFKCRRWISSSSNTNSIEGNSNTIN